MRMRAFEVPVRFTFLRFRLLLGIIHLSRTGVKQSELMTNVFNMSDNTKNRRTHNLSTKQAKPHYTNFMKQQQQRLQVTKPWTTVGAVAPGPPPLTYMILVASRRRTCSSRCSTSKKIRRSCSDKLSSTWDAATASVRGGPDASTSASAAASAAAPWRDRVATPPWGSRISVRPTGAIAGAVGVAIDG